MSTFDMLSGLVMVGGIAVFLATAILGFRYRRKMSGYFTAVRRQRMQKEKRQRPRPPRQIWAFFRNLID